MADEYISREALLQDISDAVRFTVKSGEPSAEMRGANKIIDRIRSAPAADVVSKADYDELLKAARAMHTWIFLHSFDELEAYDECKLTPEMNALLGYGGRLEIRSKGDG